MSPEGQQSDANTGPLFVQRQTYRRRRLVDAARALPLLGMMLWSIPLLWGVSETPMRASSGLVFVFMVWIWLVLVAWALVFALRTSQNGQTQDGELE
jgi:hypothetical protein